jgi:hypothetical protein
MSSRDSDEKRPLNWKWSSDGKIATISIDVTDIAPPRVVDEVEALRLSLAGLEGDDPAGAAAALEWIVSADATRQLVHAAIAAPVIDAQMRVAFHLQWTVRGFRIRESVDDDVLLAAALRRLLPPYEGPGLTLYRGEQATRVSRGEVGFGWTQDRAVAEMFAAGLCTTYPGGGVLLETAAPADAIIAAPSAHSSYLGEREFVVDPQRVGPIVALGHFPQIK